ncbi:MAG: hypothetical protein H6599_08855 [Flavobacteriales bacterium]|nr:hypothetical protein [Flavobacteriales bacterium]
MWVIGVILIAVGIGLFFYKKKVEDKLLDVKYYDQTDIKSAVETCLSVSQELGTGHYSQMIKVSAKAHSDQPLVGEFSDSPCVYYEASVVHEFEKLVERKDENGKVHRNWVGGTEMVGSTRQGGLFHLNDGSGDVMVNIDGAKLTINSAVNQFKSSGGSVNFSFGTYYPENTRQKRSKGYRELESNIPVGQQLFILGELNDRSGTPTITISSEKKNPFIVSIKSEEQVISGLEGKIKGLNIGAIACGVIGVIMIIANFFVK